MTRYKCEKFQCGIFSEIISKDTNIYLFLFFFVAKKVNVSFLVCLTQIQKNEEKNHFQNLLQGLMHYIIQIKCIQRASDAWKIESDIYECKPSLI